MNTSIPDDYRADFEIEEVGDGWWRLRDKRTGMYFHHAADKDIPEGMPYEHHYRHFAMAMQDKQRFTGMTIVELRCVHIELRS